MSSVNFQQLLNDYGAGTEPIPDGEYDVMVFNTAVKSTRTQPPKHMITARLRVVAGPYANRVTVHNFVLSPDSAGAMFHWFRNFAILGLGHDYFAQNPSIEQVAADLMNRTARVQLVTEGSRQNVNFQQASSVPAASAAPVPQAPQPGVGMAPQPGAMPQFQQPQVPQFQQPAPAMQQPQVAPPQVAAPPVQQPAPASAPQPAAAPGVQMPEGFPAQFGAPPAAQAAPQPQAPMEAPNPMAGVVQPQAAPAPTQDYTQPTQQAQPQPMAAGPLPAPPGMEQQAPEPEPVQAPAGTLPIPGSPPPEVPV